MIDALLAGPSGASVQTCSPSVLFKKKKKKCSVDNKNEKQNAEFALPPFILQSDVFRKQIMNH